jgi:phage terminase small subunit
VAIEDLPYRRRLFVDFYLGEANGSATEAARLAGYAQPHSQGPRLLENVGVRGAIGFRLSVAAATADEVLGRLTDQARADMGDFVTIGRDGHYRVDLKKARRRGKLALIKELKPTEFGLAIKLYDAQAALAHLGKAHGLFRDRLSIDLPDQLEWPDDREPDEAAEPAPGPGDGEAAPGEV